MFRPGATGQDSGRFGAAVFDYASMIGPLLMAGSGLASGLMGADAASSAADTQSAAARYAADLQAAQKAQTRADLLPYNAAGQNALTMLSGRLADLSSPITMTQADLEATPGYQFTRDQGLKATQSAAAAKGLGISGAALKGAARFATGLADATYDKRFANELASRKSNYDMLIGPASLGENAAAQTGTLGNASTTSQTNALMSGANAQAAGDVGSANALSNALTGGVNNYLNYSMLQKLLGSGSGGTAKAGTF